MPAPYRTELYRQWYEAERTRLVRLARAVLLFHRGGPWTPDDRHEWERLTGSTEATNKALCDFARSLLPPNERPPAPDQ